MEAKCGVETCHEDTTPTDAGKRRHRDSNCGKSGSKGPCALARAYGMAKIRRGPSSARSTAPPPAAPRAPGACHGQGGDVRACRLAGQGILARQGKSGSRSAAWQARQGNPISRKLGLASKPGKSGMPDKPGIAGRGNIFFARQRLVGTLARQGKARKGKARQVWTTIGVCGMTIQGSLSPIRDP
eukprot:gene22750-biopygen14807